MIKRFGEERGGWGGRNLCAHPVTQWTTSLLGCAHACRQWRQWISIFSLSSYCGGVTCDLPQPCLAATDTLCCYSIYALCLSIVQRKLRIAMRCDGSSSKLLSLSLPLFYSQSASCKSERSSTPSDYAIRDERRGWCCGFSYFFSFVTPLVLSMIPCSSITVLDPYAGNLRTG